MTDRHDFLSDKRRISTIQFGAGRDTEVVVINVVESVGGIA